MALSLFHPSEQDKTIGERSAFELGSERTPTALALRHHLALEWIVQFPQQSPSPR